VSVDNPRTQLLALIAVLALGACDAGPSAVPVVREPPRAEASTTVPAPVFEVPATPTAAAKPAIWSSNRSMTSEENARSHFEKDGADFGARTVQEFVEKAHAFTADPPRGTEILRRPNGDKLFYHAKTNVFAVTRRDGAPRTMFKPRNGADYWQEQKRIEAARAAG